MGDTLDLKDILRDVLTACHPVAARHRAQQAPVFIGKADRQAVDLHLHEKVDVALFSSDLVDVVFDRLI